MFNVFNIIVFFYKNFLHCLQILNDLKVVLVQHNVESESFWHNCLCDGLYENSNALQSIEIAVILVWCIQCVPLPPDICSGPVWIPACMSTDRCSFYLLHCALKQMNAGRLNVWMPSEMLLKAMKLTARSDRCGNLKQLRKLFEFGLYRSARLILALMVI